MKFIVLFALICTIINRSYGYFINVDAHAEECFFDRLNQGTKMGLTFEVAEGGFLDIDVTITGPSGQSIFNGEREENGKYTFAANEAGEYTYCFSNKRSTVTPKVVMFNVDINEPTKPEEHVPEVDGDNSVKLDDMIKDLSTAMWEVKNEQNYMQVRDRNHRAINESTNFRVVLWTVFESSALVCITLGQVYYLKRFFEVRRVV